jgi:biopolymer transport protein ExbD
MNRRRGFGGGNTEVTLPITPMLDMTFQLLFLFIASYHAPVGLEGQMDLSLPSDTAKPKAADIRDVDPTVTSAPETLPDLKDDITIIVQTQSGGGQQSDSISRMTVRTRADDPVDYDPKLEALEKKLREIVEKDGPKQTVRIQGDSELKCQGLMKVMDACRRAGLQDIGFTAPPDYGQYQK